MEDYGLTGLELMALNKSKLSLEDAPQILNKFAEMKGRRLNLLLRQVT